MCRVMALLLLIAPIVFCDDQNFGFSVFNTFSNFIDGIQIIANTFNSFREIFSIISEKNNYNDKIIPVNEDAFLNITELAIKNGYNIEEHSVTTEDGYILTLHRMQRSNNSTPNGTVVFLMHGIFDSSDSWILQGPGKALAYNLADRGYDVWLGNTRGNKYSHSHDTFSPDQSEFWDFTWEEIGFYDLPAMLDYTLTITAKGNLFYVGHSQGTTSFFVMNSLRPEYNSKVNMMFSLAPVAWMKHVKSPIIRMFSPAQNVLGYLLSTINTYSPTDLFKRLTSICGLLSISCDNYLYSIIGYNYKFINESLIPVILTHVPSGSSTLQLIHYGQLVTSGRFSQYDFGNEKNLEYYGQEIPPDYNLTKVTTPIALYYGGDDWISDPEDVEILKSHLPNVVDYVLIDEFNHLDFMYATAAADKLYNIILDHIVEYESTYI